VYPFRQIGGETPELSARLDLVSHILREPLFNTLRTQEQLGAPLFQHTPCCWPH
jgi:secreted Zn-dependent insulinase-like peptidase